MLALRRDNWVEDSHLRLGPEGSRGPWRADEEQDRTCGRVGACSPPGSLPDFTSPPPSTSLLLSFQLGLQSHRLPPGAGECRGYAGPS